MATANFFQSIGKAHKSIILSLSRQVIILIPCLLILPHYFGVKGVWYSMPVSDLVSSILAMVMLAAEVKKFKHKLQA